MLVAANAVAIALGVDVDACCYLAVGMLLLLLPLVRLHRTSLWAVLPLLDTITDQ